MKSEAKLKKDIMAYLKTLEPDVFAFRVESRPGMGRGVADILVCWNGRFVAIEAKIPGGRTTPLQNRFLSKVLLAHGVSIVAHNVAEVRGLVDLLPIGLK